MAFTDAAGGDQGSDLEKEVDALIDAGITDVDATVLFSPQHVFEQMCCFFVLLHILQTLAELNAIADLAGLPTEDGEPVD